MPEHPIAGPEDSAPGPETVFTYAAPPLLFGPGAVDEIGYHLAGLGAARVLVVTDAGVAATGAADRVRAAAGAYGIDAAVFSEVHVEPTDASLRAAAEHARGLGRLDAVVAVGGGSSIDTAKAVCLLLTNPGDLTDYLNPPIGAGRAPERPVLPLVAVPTTTGTGSESTSVCVLDVLALRVKTGISHPRLRPALAVVDPTLSATQPPFVTVASGMDVLCHALESWTARPYTAFARKRPEERVPYCGANPVSDLWAERSLALLAGALRAAVRDGGDQRARADLALAATFAGLGFGNAGVHLPHANAYPIAGQVRDYRPDGYPADEPLVPHGIAVALTAPECFRFTFDCGPERHLRAASLLAGEPGAGGTGPGAGEGAGGGPGPGGGGGADLGALPARERLPAVLTALMRDVGVPNGLAAVGYAADDIGALVPGTMAQQRLLAIAPRAVTPDDVAGILRRSLSLW